MEKMKGLSVSVVIPARNERDYIGKCLDSLVKQDYPINLLHIVVVDGSSEDGTIDIVTQYQQQYGYIHLVMNQRKVTPAALNLGIMDSDSDVVIILGAHSFVKEDWIRQNVEALVRSGADCVGGPIESISETPLSSAISSAMSSPFGVGNARFRYSEQEAFVDTVAFGAYRREVFNRIGLFDEELVRNQDDEFNFRLIQSGGRILLSPLIRSSYYTRGSLGKLWRQYYQYGFWKVRVIQKHRKIPSLRHLVPPIFAAGILLLPFLSLLHPIICILTIIIFGIYLLMIILFAFKVWDKKAYRLIPAIAAAFLILHFSYGLGFYEGVLHFYILKRKNKQNRNTLSSR